MVLELFLKLVDIYNDGTYGDGSSFLAKDYIGRFVVGLERRQAS